MNAIFWGLLLIAWLSVCAASQAECSILKMQPMALDKIPFMFFGILGGLAFIALGCFVFMKFMKALGLLD